MAGFSHATLTRQQEETVMFGNQRKIFFYKLSFNMETIFPSKISLTERRLGTLAVSSFQNVLVLALTD